MRNRTCSLSALCTAVLLGLAMQAAATVPLELPRPDGKPADQTKPVQVYILAGQSNMVGMGDLRGARPRHPTVYYSPDPAVIPGPMPVGSSAVARMQITDGRGAVYQGAFDPDADYAKADPAVTAFVQLGVTRAELPTAPGDHVIVVTATMKVPDSGQYRVHAGFEDSSYNVTTVGGEEVYRRDLGGKRQIKTIELEAGKAYPVAITYFRGGSAAFWVERIDIEGRGDLETIVKKDGQLPWLIDDAGDWAKRSDVFFTDARIGDGSKSSPLNATSNGKSIGPELGFGLVMGEFHEAPVLLIKTSMGNRSLGFDFRPPSSGRPNPDSEWEGLEYRLMVEGVNKALANIADLVPGYRGQGYRIAGFGWFQGHKDGGAPKQEYEEHLVNLIKDVRKDFNSPEMRAVVATVGFGGWRMGEKYRGIHAAQMAVGDRRQHPEFAGTVASVDTRDFWREIEESPRSQDYHYHRNAETYYRIGDAMGRAMVRTLGGKAEPIPATDRKARATAAAAAEAEAVEPTDQAKARSLAAIKPMIVDGAMVSFLTSPRNAGAIAAAISGERPKRTDQFPRDVIDDAADYFVQVADTGYLWQDFGPDLKNGPWRYHSFDSGDGKRGEGMRQIKLPEGMENWAAPEFDPAAAGWKTGHAPFAQKGGERVAIGRCGDNFCRCGVEPKTLWQHEVLLMRTTVDVPPLKPGHRYRILLGGASHVNGGEGWALYVDGKLMAESKSGVGKRQGGQPRGAHVYNDFKPAFEDGKVTIAVMALLRYNHPRIENYPPTGHLSVWIEQQKLPPID